MSADLKLIRSRENINRDFEGIYYIIFIWIFCAKKVLILLIIHY